MILFKCDRCGKVIGNCVHQISVNKFSNADYAMDSPISTEGDILLEKLHAMQLCRDCIEQIAACVMNYGTGKSEGGCRPHTAASRFRNQSRNLNRQMMTAAS